VLTTTLVELKRHSLPNAKDRDDLHLARQWIQSHLIQAGITTFYRVGSSARGTAIRSNRQLDYYLDTTPQAVEVLESTLLLSQRYRVGGMKYYHFRHQIGGLWFKFDLIPIYNSPVTAQRALTHQRYMQAHLTPHLRENIIFAKAVLKRAGLYNADEKVRGFSGWAVEVMVLTYGGLQGIPDNTSHVSCLVQPQRNVLGSVSAKNLHRFYLLRKRDFLWRPGRDPTPALYQYTGDRKIDRHPHVRASVHLPSYTLVQVAPVVKGPVHPGVISLPPSYYMDKPGTRLYSTPKGYVKITTPDEFCRHYGLVPISPHDHTNIRIFNYFR